MSWSVTVDHLLPTHGRHHTRPGVPYVVAVSSDTPTDGFNRFAVLERTTEDERTVAVIVRLVVDPSCPPGAVHVDQTVRTALGLPVRVPEEGVEQLEMRLASVDTSLRDHLRDRLSFIAGRRYVLLRVAPPDPADIEKRVCRIQRDDLVALGTSPGSRVVLFGAAPHDGRYELRRSRLQALDLTDERVHHRRGAEEAQVERGWQARYPCARALLGVEGDDLNYVFIDRECREALGLRPGDPVLVRRDTISAISNEVQDFGITFLASLLALSQVASSLVGLTVAFAIAACVVVLRLRSDLG